MEAEHAGQEKLEGEARILTLEMKRDRILEALEHITAEIYSEIKRLELFESPEDVDPDDGCPA
jgi:hypothetical protein